MTPTLPASLRVGSQMFEAGTPVPVVQDAIDGKIAQLRQRLFNNRQVDGYSHSTACSIWGDDGQGGTAEGFALPPCNCGALINWEKRNVAKIAAVNADLGADNQALRAEIARLKAIFTQSGGITPEEMEDAADVCINGHVYLAHQLIGAAAAARQALLPVSSEGGE